MNWEPNYYTRYELLLRSTWQGLGFLFRLSPRHFYWFRNFMLRCFGAKVGFGVRIYPTAIIMHPWLFEIGDNSSVGDGANIYNLGLVAIGQNSTISQQSYICGGSHQYTDISMPLVRGSIIIGNHCWVAARAFIGPGAILSDFSVVGANSTFFGTALKYGIYVGSPAKLLKYREINK